jgi:steroid delta-isomerase-like uncharacterized protein
MKHSLIYLSLAIAIAFGLTACNKCDDTAKAAIDLATKNKAVAQKTVDAMNTGNLALLDSAFIPNFVEHTPDPMIEAKGIEGLKEGYSMMRTAFPDVKIEVLSMVAEGDKVMIHQTFIGTNTAAWGPMPATGKAVKADGVDIFTLKDGKITEHWAVYDAMKMMEQMGLMPDMEAGMDSTAQDSAPAQPH